MLILRAAVVVRYTACERHYSCEKCEILRECCEIYVKDVADVSELNRHDRVAREHGRWSVKEILFLNK